MPYTQSNDIFDVYRGTEDQITNINRTPIKDGNVYFAYDKDDTIPQNEILASKLYFDANEHRFVVAGGGDISFIKAHPAETPAENLDGYYEFNMSDIDAHKVNEDNILITDDNVLYRVVSISEDGETVYTSIIVGGGGAGGVTANPLSIQWQTNLPNRIIDTKSPAGVVLLNCNSASITQGILEVTCNGKEVTELTNNYQTLGKRIPVSIQIPTSDYLNIGSNEIRVTIRTADYQASIIGQVTVFHAEFAPRNDWNPRRIFGTDTTSVDVQNIISYPYTFTGLSNGFVSGTIQVYLDDELVHTVQQLYGDGVVTINCLSDDFAYVTHSNHSLRYAAFVVVNGEMYPVQDYTYDIIWATEEGGQTPIIISSYPSVTEEYNYNIITIPYLVYQKDAETTQLHQYINGEELATSPISVSYDKTANQYLTWTIAKYVTDQTQQPNVFMLRADNVVREFDVTILPSALDLDAVEDGLLLYLSAQDRSNQESVISRQTWKYGNYAAQFEGFNWYNNGWQEVALENSEINKIVATGQISLAEARQLRTTVLRLSNGAKLTIPFNDILQETLPSTGFTIEVEFKCRNAINYSKLLQLVSYIDPDDGKEKVRKDIVYNTNGKIANAVGEYFGNSHGFAFGTQEAFFASKGKTVNVRYADNDKVKISVVAEPTTRFLYIYINGVLSGVERYDTSDDFSTNTNTIVFNSDYCDLDLYNIRIYNKPLSFDGIVKNWIGDAPDLQTKLSRYEENNITRTFTVNNVEYVTLDYQKTCKLSQDLATRYIKAGRPEGMTKGIPIMVITTYGQDELPFNKKTKQYVGIRFWDPNGEVPVVPADKQYDSSGNEVHWYGFKARNIELSVQGTSSQGYPRRNFKAKIKDPKESSSYQQQYPFEFTTWDGNNAYADVWSANTTAFADTGYEKIKKIDIGNGTQETKFCFKADFMDSSSSHNTPLANYIQTLYSYNDNYDLRHPLSLLGVNNTNTNYRTTVYGFPMLIFHERKNQPNAELEFVGRYNFNTDKSATDSFGFTIQTAHKILGNTLMDLPTGETDDAGKLILDENYKPMSEQRYPTYEDICECWELTSNQHGFTGFRRNDFGKVIEGQNHPELDFYNFWENRYSIWDFGDPAADDDVYKDDPDPNKTNAIANLRWYMRNIEALSAWIYSTDVHPWDTDDETSVNHHKLTQMTNAATMHYTVDEEGNVTLLRDYYLMPTSNTVSKVPKEWFSVIWNDDEHTSHTLVVHDPSAASDTNIALNTLYEDEINAVLDTPVMYLTRDIAWDANILTETEAAALDAATRATLKQDGNRYIKVNKTYYLSNDSDSGIPISWYHIVDDIITTQGVDSQNRLLYVLEYEDDGTTVKETTADPNQALTRMVQRVNSSNQLLWIYEYENEDGEIVQDTTANKAQAKIVNGEPVPALYEQAIPVMVQIVQASHIVVINNDGINPSTEIKIANVYELFTHDTKNYRLSKFRAEFKNHLNLDYCAAYFILTEFMILFDSREKNMMIASWGPEKEGGDYIWYPIFYDMDTQLGINNSGTVYWDYDVNAQDDGIFSGAGSVLWDNFYACFLPEIKTQYINWRNNKFDYDNCIKYYNTKSADMWTPIMKDTDAFYKYIAPAITGLGFVNQSGQTGQITDSYFFCAQGDRSLNRAAFFRNRFNYKDSEWLGGDYRTQGGSQILMRYDANATGTSDPDASNWAGDIEAIQARRAAGLDADVSFNITPYLTQYTSVYYDALPRSGGRYDIQNPPPEGYVTVTPLESIKQNIDNGVSFTQQLVYIYGPAYLRDIGDLSLRYLDQLDINPAIRLNRLVLGNDNPLYRNDGATLASIQINSPYKDASGALNPNAKSLLEYLDLSNLSNMKGGIDVTGCLKLKTVRALGSSLTAINLPEGNVISTLYLPDTNEDIILIKSQALDTIIRNESQCLSSNFDDHISAPGLFIKAVTTELNVEANQNVITEYMNNGTINIGSYPANFIKNNIKRYQLEGGKLGFNSYELLDYIVKSKIIMHSNPSAGDKLTVRIRLLDVDWSPYELLDESATRVNGITYYIRNSNNTYSELSTDITFDYANKNLGGVYRYNIDKVLRYSASENKHGLPDLNILKLFIQDFDDNTKTNQNGDYLFRDTFESNNQKFLPHIGGEIYIDNDIAIDEYELYTIQERYNAVLGINDTPMTICAKTVTDCKRAQFVEMVDDKQTILATYRSNSASAKVFPTAKDKIADCVRQHYDFKGWVSKTDAMAYDSTFIDENGVPLSNSIVLKNSEILNHLVDLDTLVFGNTPEVYYAVFVLHEYSITYILDEALYLEDPTNTKAYETKLVPSGNVLSSNPVSVIPWKTSATQALTMMYVFKGWAYHNENSPRDLSRIRAQADLTLYPVFEEDSVYNNPLDAQYIDYVIHRNQVYIRGIKRHLGGKVCIPNYIEGYPVISIVGSIFNGTNYTGVNPIGDSNEVTLLASNGFQQNNDITHIFFQGSNNNGSNATINSLGDYCFAHCTSLEYIDMPPTLKAFGNSCCYNCWNLSFASLSYVESLGYRAFAYTNYANNSYDKQVKNRTLSITANDNLTINQNVFNMSGWETITIGSESNPWNPERLPTRIVSAKGTFALDSGGVPDGGLHQITVYSSVFDQSYFHNINSDALLPNDLVSDTFNRTIWRV